MAGDTKAATSAAAAAAAIDEEDEGESKSLYALIEDNAFLIEALLYFVFLTLFTVYAVGAHGNSNEAYTIAEQMRRIYAGFSKVSDTSSWFDYMVYSLIHNQQIHISFFKPKYNIVNRSL
jgi:hypothetical protein